MKYKVLLIGNKEVIINESAKEKLEQVVRGGAETFVEIDGQYVKTSAIKAILKIGEEVSSTAFQDRNKVEMDEWNKTCERMADLSIQEKTEKEMEVRVMPGWRLSKQDKDDPLLSDAYGAIVNFFEENPMYPRCPMKIWFPILRSKLQSKGDISRWFEMIARNDDAIERWIEYARANK